MKSSEEKPSLPLQGYSVREAKIEEFAVVGKLLVEVYSQLKGFPSQAEQPGYYNLLLNVGDLCKNKNVKLFVAVSDHEEVCGAVVFFKFMKDYGSGGNATQEKYASGFRLLAVDPLTRGLGIGKMLSMYCVEEARKVPARQLVIHSTRSMEIAWRMYEKIGFQRARELDFLQGDLEVYGFRLIF